MKPVAGDLFVSGIKSQMKTQWLARRLGSLVWILVDLLLGSLCATSTSVYAEDESVVYRDKVYSVRATAHGRDAIELAIVSCGSNGSLRLWAFTLRQERFGKVFLGENGTQIVVVNTNLNGGSFLTLAKKYDRSIFRNANGGRDGETMKVDVRTVDLFPQGTDLQMSAGFVGLVNQTMTEFETRMHPALETVMSGVWSINSTAAS